MTALARRTTIPLCFAGARISGNPPGQGNRTTIPAKDEIRAGNLISRDFTPPRPEHTWVVDFTYCRTWAGSVYVAINVDGFSRRIVDGGMAASTASR